MLQKPDKDKKPFECPHCGSMNTEWCDCGDIYDDVRCCKNCDSTWFEHVDDWHSVFQEGKIIVGEDVKIS